MRDAIRRLAEGLPDVVRRPCWGEEGFFHRPPGSTRRLGRLFLTIRDDPARGEGGVRYSVALPPPLYAAWFGPPPARPRRREAFESGRRHGPFRPHPVYAWAGWAQAVDPGPGDAEALARAVREAYGRAVERGDAR
ncbi:MAG TPA: DUF6194 family protein [Candidatus Thermoplasmatota archaeon]|nr:DUF6194 family protein [Candidatus Thermoplasmatota archaeon]